MITVNNRDKLEWYNNMTVQDVLDTMGYSFVLITVTVNKDLVPKENYQSYKIPDNADINVFHLFHGG